MSYPRLSIRATNAPCCPATCAVCGNGTVDVSYLVDSDSKHAASPKTRMLPNESLVDVGQRSHLSTFTYPPDPAASLGQI